MREYKKRTEKRKEPLWEGPESDGDQGGVTQSLISRYLVCKERFRLMVIEGWRPNEGFSGPLEYGDMWHVCEEIHAAQGDWLSGLKQHCMGLARKFPTEGKQVEKYYNACLNQFPVYVDWWAKHDDVKRRTPLMQEETFKVPYTLPSGRVVYLRGKWDSVDLLAKQGIYLQENKTKGRIDENYLLRQLTFDLQTMTYYIALGTQHAQVAGIRYNVIRRPFSGRGPSTLLKNVNTGKRGPNGEKLPKREETVKEIGIRVGEKCLEEPKLWFFRWKVDIGPDAVQTFKDQFLDPCLEEMCMWYEYQTQGAPLIRTHESVNRAIAGHYRLPYGIYNPILEGRGSDVEEYLLSGSTVGLQRIDDLFPELAA